MVISPREETFTSPFAHSLTPEKHGEDVFYQHKFLQDAWKRYLMDPFEANVDLRGRKFEVILHEDGLNVTIREIPGA